ncbi:hypothetical protein BC826DRAFT_1109259 [Russula brevipes]|nr:hypothetical protein BC826DRAFT_1109259 [Russula brevipes]
MVSTVRDCGASATSPLDRNRAPNRWGLPNAYQKAREVSRAWHSHSHPPLHQHPPSHAPAARPSHRHVLPARLGTFAAAFALTPTACPSHQDDLSARLATAKATPAHERTRQAPLVLASPALSTVRLVDAGGAAVSAATHTAKSTTSYPILAIATPDTDTGRVTTLAFQITGSPSGPTGARPGSPSRFLPHLQVFTGMELPNGAAVTLKYDTLGHGIIAAQIPWGASPTLLLGTADALIIGNYMSGNVVAASLSTDVPFAVLQVTDTGPNPNRKAPPHPHEGHHTWSRRRCCVLQAVSIKALPSAICSSSSALGLSNESKPLAAPRLGILTLPSTTSSPLASARQTDFCR